MTSAAHVAFLGAGPGGTGPLYAALKRGEAGRLLERGAVWLDAGEQFGSGAIGNYRITSDTQADVLLECLPSDIRAPLGDVIGTDEARAIQRYSGGPLPLKVASQFLARAGQSVRKLVERAPSSEILSNVCVAAVHIEEDGFRIVREGSPEEVRSRFVVSAMGGISPRSEALDAPLPDGRTPGRLALKCVVTTDELFRNGVEAYVAQVPSGRPLRVVVLGGSHSAYASAVKLIAKLGAAAVRIQILCRRLPKLFYPTLEAAHAEGYVQATQEDVCPVTKRVFRLAGLRLSARDLVRRVWGLGNAPRDESIEIVHLAQREPAFAARTMEEADLVVLALGYRARTVPFFRNGERISLLAETGRQKPLVDGQCRLLLADGTPLPGAFGLGLASGFVPHGAMGGEPSFDGQTNGLWLYQNDVGARVLEPLLA
jgi:hypothetical protein